MGEPEQHGLFDRKTESTGERNQIELLRNLKLRGGSNLLLLCGFTRYCVTDS